MRPLQFVPILCLLCCGGPAFSEPIFSGPQSGERLPPLRVSLVYGSRAGETVDLIEEAQGTPTLLVIVNGSNRPAARLTRILMNYAEMYSAQLFAGVVYLDQDKAAAVEQLGKAISWWKVAAPVGVSVDGAEGPGSYGLNRNVNLTVLVANEGRVVRNHALVQPSETDAPGILKDVVDLVGGRVPSTPEVLFLSVPVHKPPNVSWRNAPADVRLRGLMCAVLAASDTKAAREAASAVESYIGQDAEKQAVLGNAAGLLLQRRGRVTVGDIPAVVHLRRWRNQYDPQAQQRQ